MDYQEFLEKVVAVTEESINLQFSVVGYLWPNAKCFPVEVSSLGEEKGTVIKVPNKFKKSNGVTVAVTGCRKNVFKGQEHITDIILPREQTWIPKGAFDGCKNLQRITIPSGVKHILEGTFRGCDSLQDVYYEGTEEEWRGVSIVHEGYRVNDKKLGLYCDVEKFPIPGNEPLLNANIHYNCSFDNPEISRFTLTVDGRDVTDLFKLRKD